MSLVFEGSGYAPTDELFVLVIPALDSVFRMMLTGFRESFWDPFAWKVARS